MKSSFASVLCYMVTLSLILSFFWLGPYPTRPCVVIEPAVSFMGFLVQLESFDYSSLKMIDNQTLVYILYNEETNDHKKLSSSINHECTVQIDGVVKISVHKVIGVSDFSMQTFSVNMYKYDNKKGVNVLFRALTTLVPESWIPRLYAIFLCDLALRQSMWLCIY